MGGSQGPAGLRKRFPVRQPVESPPPFGDGCGGFCKPNRLGAIHGCIYLHGPLRPNLGLSHFTDAACHAGRKKPRALA